MSTYVFSDVHGHAAALKRCVERIAPGADDSFYCLGDMIDRGPAPLDVIAFVRSLPNVHVLMGNHEDLMMHCMADPDDGLNAMNWGMNGGAVTSEGLADLDEQAADEVVDWVASLPRSARVQVAGRDYLLVHAGIDAARVAGEAPWDGEKLDALLAAQDPEDLLWIRESFWGAPTGLVDERGTGPIVIAGHTPTVYLERLGAELAGPVLDAEGRCLMARLGACEATGGVADRWDIDAGAACGAGLGQVLVLRLDDGEAFYEPILEGE